MFNRQLYLNHSAKSIPPENQSELSLGVVIKLLLVKHETLVKDIISSALSVH